MPKPHHSLHQFLKAGKILKQVSFARDEKKLLLIHSWSLGSVCAIIK
jgi:hypothetical protein